LLVELAEALGDFSDVQGRGLVGRGLGVQDRELEVPAGQLPYVLADAIEGADESMVDQPRRHCQTGENK
jgi:hypothetical protein